MTKSAVINYFWLFV